jgi:selenocysteine lyase/cysteine desulfurase
MYAPKGSAVLWVAPSLVTTNFPEPTVISSENSFSSNTRSDGLAQLNDEYVYDVVYDRSLSKAQNEDADVDVDGADTDADPLYHRYVYTSTKDYTAIVSLGAAIDFYDDMLGGEDMVYNYTRSLALQAKHYLVEKWKTQIMAPDDMEVFMFHVVLPRLTHDDDDDETNKIEIAKELQQWLYDEKGMYVVIAQEPSSGLFYTRLSAQVYLQMDDFERLGDAVLEFLRR